VSWRAPTDTQRFEEAAEWFLRRLPITPEQFYELATHWRREAFTITGVAQARVLQDAIDLIDRAMNDGTSLRAFKDEALPKLEAAWAGTVRDPGYRVETIYRNAVQTAYNDGRHELMTDPDVMRARPFWMYDAILDEATTELCASLNDTILPADDPFWSSHWPPLHHRCRSAVRSLSRSEAERRGITSVPPTEQPESGWGTPRRSLTNSDALDLTGAPDSIRSAYEQRQARAPNEPSAAATRVAQRVYQPSLFPDGLNRAL